MTKNIRLAELHLSNFKGVKSFTLETGGESAKVYGDNATGKTTLFDAFTWLLFDKDSQNKKDFEIKTLSKDNKAVSGVEHEVSAVLLIDGKAVELKKVYSEKWTKKRGSAKQVFSGHTTDYHVNGVPVKKKEFVEKVNDIISEDIFKLITSPSYFNEQMKWQDRLNVLMEIGGAVTDDDVIKKNSSLSKLHSILEERSLDEQKSILAEKRKKINKLLEQYPVRIDEINRSIEDVTTLNQEQLKEDLKALQASIDDLEKEARCIRADAGADRKKRMLQLEGELQQIKNDHDSERFQIVNEKKEAYYLAKNSLTQTQNDLINLIAKKEHLTSFLSQIDKERLELREEWSKKYEESFEDHQTDCPTCGQALPEEKIQAAIEKFNLQKSDSLERIADKGKQLGIEYDKKQNELYEVDEQIQKLNLEEKFKASNLEKLKEDMEKAEASIAPLSNNPTYIEKVEEIEKIKNEIQSDEQETIGTVQAINEQIKEKQQEMTLIRNDLSRIDQAQKALNRIDELKEEERKMADEYNDVEQQSFLIEEFIRTKMNLMEERINSKFKFARFKLFEEQVNGGLTETCETLYEGVPYSKGLNNAARINVGLDIINTLNEHYGISAPIFVDNSEAVTNLIDVNAQVISLIVSEKDKQLRVKTDDNLLTVDCEVIA
ncbi:AAA family ATPase [Bacillus pumilus]|uniref:AAA family ATPase n=1 Tax=Bacillus TaxID=1386 RepID=UPI002281EBA6|nr:MULTISPECIES: AAA family ATPase [Bacillus]MCY7678080.1 AAA family ATPase [Bacillus pumilus]MCY7713848.1 AAA family ATPase [Bacillus altitudinis]